MSYINRKQTENAIRKYAELKHSNGEQIEYINGILKAISVINEQPAACVTEISHGKWLTATAFEVFGGEEQAWGQNPIAMLYCSNCQEEPYIDKDFLDDETLGNLMTDFCPHCGAKMDE